MRNSVRRILLLLTGIALTVGIGVGQVQAAAAPIWRTVFLSHSSRDNFLMGVAAPAKDDAWAIGRYVYRTGLVLYHWNGSGWSWVNVPGAAPNFQADYVSALATDDVWIIGGVGQTPAGQLLHWDGHTWRTVAVPDGAENADTVVTAPNSLWSLEPTGCGRPCTTIYHWNGTRWLTSLAPLNLYQIVASGGKLYGVAETRWNEAQQSFVPVIYQLAGATWVRRFSINTRLRSPVAAAGTGQGIWIWGYLNYQHTRSVLYHWTGSAVRAVPVPPNMLTNGGLTADGHGGVWIGPYVHWTGHKWINLSWQVPKFGTLSDSLAAVPGTGSTWLVGLIQWRNRAEGFVAVNGALP
jgi:hypothetical protein